MSRDCIGLVIRANTSSVPPAPHAPPDGGEGGGRGLPDPVSHYDSLILLITRGQAAVAATVAAPLISRTTATQIFERSSYITRRETYSSREETNNLLPTRFSLPANTTNTHKRL
ncbi:hypothetical protein E2C01_011511 [Portunus trituberculatus]|uniref:Uncharacterized protein n=1 Tax=Portunus trituberculatus TaxID=210409 RepID=A0A5B7DBK2_PORTR|nr:hypothetical protein [Portunus trituberculatus]